MASKKQLKKRIKELEARLPAFERGDGEGDYMPDWTWRPTPTIPLELESSVSTWIYDGPPNQVIYPKLTIDYAPGPYKAPETTPRELML